MKQIELTSKLVLGIIGLVSVSAILVPTYAVPTIRSGDIFDGEVKTADLANGAVTNSKLANDAVTSSKIKNGEVTTDDIKDATIQEQDIADGVIPDGGGVQPTVHQVRELATVPAHSTASAQAFCPSGELVTGGGFVFENFNDINILTSQPSGVLDAEGTGRWHVSVINTSDFERPFTAIAMCMDFSP